MRGRYSQPGVVLAAVRQLDDLGAGKYGTFNWRDRPIEVMDYISAMRRHLALLESGDWEDRGSGLPLRTPQGHRGDVYRCPGRRTS